MLGKFDDPLLAAEPALAADLRPREVDRLRGGAGCVSRTCSPGACCWCRRTSSPARNGRSSSASTAATACRRTSSRATHRAYHDFAARLAERGFIVFAPHNPYRGEDRYRFLSRKANTIKASLFSFILAQHQQILNWLEKLPQVDAKRIAFYG